MMNENKEVIMNDRTVMLIKLLRENGRTKREELAKILNCSERQVQRHKEIAEKFGYKINSYFGNINQGYELAEEKLTKEELKTLENKVDSELYEKIIRIINKV